MNCNIQIDIGLRKALKQVRVLETFQRSFTKPICNGVGLN